MADLTLLHISDLHFGPYYVQRVGEALLDIAPQLHPDLIVASGDFTQRAKPEQFEAARDFLAALPDVPRLVVPGNHDIPLYRVFERLLDPYRHYSQYISEKLDQVLRVPRADIVGLNSAAPYQAVTNGRISRRQLEFCAQAFAEAPEDTVRIVVAHHHLAPAPDYEGGDVMPRAKRAIDCFTRFGVELVLGGHLHRAYIGSSLDVYPGADRERGIIIVQCGTTTSRRGRVREREKNSFNLIRIDNHLIQIMHYMYFEESHGFAPISQHLFPRLRKRFLQLAPERMEAFYRT